MSTIIKNKCKEKSFSPSRKWQNPQQRQNVASWSFILSLPLYLPHTDTDKWCLLNGFKSLCAWSCPPAENQSLPPPGAIALATQHAISPLTSGPSPASAQSFCSSFRQESLKELSGVTSLHVPLAPQPTPREFQSPQSTQQLWSRSPTSTLSKPVTIFCPCPSSPLCGSADCSSLLERFSLKVSMIQNL